MAIKLPSFIYGTAWKGEATRGHVTAALAAGFTAVDTANQPRHYHEPGTGEALAGLPPAARAALFIQTKYTPPGGHDERVPYDPAADARTRVRQSFASSLEHLGVERLSAYLVHGPAGPVGLTPDDLLAWRTVLELHEEGLVGLPGVSNVSAEQLEELCRRSPSPPAIVQNRCYARMGWDGAVRAVCRAHGIAYEAFSLLTGNRDLLDHPALLEVARAHEALPSGVVFRFAQQVGMIPLTGTTDPVHMAEDLACDRFDLGEEELWTVERVAILTR